MKPRMYTFAVCLVLTSVLMSSCVTKNASRSPSTAISEIEGSQSERIEKIMQFVNKSGKLKTSVKDAHAIEKKIGDGVFGPYDYVSFIALEVNKSAIGDWRTLSPKSTDYKYIAPPKQVDWWVNEEEFNRLEFFDAFGVIGRNGWIGVSAQGKVYIYGFTT